MKEIIIHVTPQECGGPYIMVVDSATGQEVKTIGLPELSGYYSSGCEFMPTYVPTGRTSTRKSIEYSSNSTPSELPKIGSKVRRGGNYWELVSIENHVEVCNGCTDTGLTSVYKHSITIHYAEMIQKSNFKYDASKDTYKKEMEKLGFNMKGWCVYKRRKTNYKDFIRALFPNALNVIFV